MRIDRFQDLFVWQIADELRREIIAFTDRDPAAKDFKFRDQIETRSRRRVETRGRVSIAFVQPNLPAPSNSRADRWAKSRTA